MTEKQKIAESVLKVFNGFKNILDLHGIQHVPSTNEYNQLRILESDLIDDMWYLLEIHDQNSSINESTE